MCGRYSLTKTDLKKRFGLLDGNCPYDESYNISPSTVNPVIIRNSPNSLVLMKWGLIPFWARDPKIGFRMINARVEDIENKPAFRKPIRSQRCLIPATGFYEWKRLNLEGIEEKVPFYIYLKKQEIFSFAGVYDVWTDAEARRIYSYAIITTSANEMMRSIHDRMPVILDMENEDRYLDKNTKLSEILEILKTSDTKKMSSYPISKLVNDPRNDTPEIIKKLS
jgi:putative SOS response-associated peptidase YedK